MKIFEFIEQFLEKTKFYLKKKKGCGKYHVDLC